jgi:hypothetical protein
MPEIAANLILSPYPLFSKPKSNPREAGQKL